MGTTQCFSEKAAYWNYLLFEDQGELPKFIPNQTLLSSLNHGEQHNIIDTIKEHYRGNIPI